MAYTAVATVADGDDLLESWGNNVAAAVDEIQGGIGSDSGTAPTWVPTWTNLTVGNGTVVARYTQMGPLTTFYINLAFGTTTSITGSVVVSAPTTIFNTANAVALSRVQYTDASASATYAGGLSIASATTFNVRRFFDSGIAGNPTQEAAITATAPFAFAQTDQLSIAGLYFTA